MVITTTDIVVKMHFIILYYIARAGVKPGGDFLTRGTNYYYVICIYYGHSKLITVLASAARDKTAAGGGGFRTNFISFRTSPTITTSTTITNGLAFFIQRPNESVCRAQSSNFSATRLAVSLIPKFCSAISCF